MVRGMLVVILTIMLVAIMLLLSSVHVMVVKVPLDIVPATTATPQGPEP